MPKIKTWKKTLLLFDCTLLLRNPNLAKNRFYFQSLEYIMVQRFFLQFEVRRTGPTLTDLCGNA